ncbi:CBS domain-containing protein [Actinomadura algeriensis]|uniref:Transcriptional regulator n=1 Tax=Actinomadura algeriensis TaxID=1679523 RepID=A0ABR9JJZ8_9ACTN|nr:CBS domain-containing protein [Actinomadura algeriensis]MBE1530870.1 putative transcriptional regulator [Actinomadura algeriensis]
MTREEFLADVAARCGSEPVEVRVRELLGRWKYAVRTEAAVEEIKAALAAHGLATVPLLEDADRVVTIVPAPEPGETETSDGSGEAGAAGDADAGSDDEAQVRVSLCVRELPSATGGVTSVCLDDSLSHAETTMLSDGFSQLAVLHDGLLRGAVTWDSIQLARARGKNGLRDALEVRPVVLHGGDDLLKEAARISDMGFAFVENGEGELTGIVTLADLAEQFITLANPFVLLSEIEQRLRRVVGRICTLEEMRQKARYPNKTHGATDLMFGDYMKIFEDPDLFGRCGWRIDRAVFVDRLGKVKDVRNNIMHFSPEPVRAGQTYRLNTFIKFIKGLDGVFDT